MTLGWQWFLRLYQNHMRQKKKNTLRFIKIKNFFTLKDTIKLLLHDCFSTGTLFFYVVFSFKTWTETSAFPGSQPCWYSDWNYIITSPACKLQILGLISLYNRFWCISDLISYHSSLSLLHVLRKCQSPQGLCTCVTFAWNTT